MDRIPASNEQTEREFWYKLFDIVIATLNEEKAANLVDHKVDMH